jgi:uncharacterized protein (TIGR02444 family)
MQESFWNFSLRVYAAPGVAQACLSLQDQHNLDVNLVLLCAWHGSHHGRIAPATFLDMHSFADAWSQNVIKPLRSVRVWMKGRESLVTNSEGDPGSFDSLRNSIKSTELHGEKIQQQQLESMIIAPQIAFDLATAQAESLANFKEYLQLANAEEIQEALEHFEIVLNNLE